MNFCALSVEVHFYWEKKNTGRRYVPVCYLDGYPVSLGFDLVRMDKATLNAAGSGCLYGELEPGDWCVRSEYLVPAEDPDDYLYYSLSDFLSRDGSLDISAMERFLAHAVSTQVHTLNQTGSTEQGEAREGGP
ncbi:hypothetical protein MHM84_18490 [Halomonas sp. McH1-25]|uniref:hypothetical protein n=1 Tax=unclassified Halomonas TaxID=2609666 RepID=UPI001EF4B060|nr:MULTISPECIES: hypothetical protein [unclassified Halomonas]MCG7601755.1 hypothetical protein [Halomonas sp. McH1-25]MCP1344039.1 hypothetical protein [Halomonas sp. FL8]MCP1363078.1 hypothetical protein [Halomonas sp. BBD45]MCP1365566.1 hypothetical protein [Halomonas sp. BBD48]